MRSNSITGFIIGEAQSQVALFSERIDDYDKKIRSALLIQLTMCIHGFNTIPASTGSPPTLNQPCPGCLLAGNLNDSLCGELVQICRHTAGDML